MWAGSVRVRMTAAVVLVVGLAMLGGALALVTLMTTTLTNEVVSTARLRGADVVELLVAEGVQEALPRGNTEDSAVQILDASGSVIGASANLAGQGPVVTLAPGEWTRTRLRTTDDAFDAVVAAIGAPDRRQTVLVARSLEPVTEATAVVTGLLAVGLPLLVLVVGATAWLVIGRALRPVEIMRREVDEISLRALDRRIPVPATADEIARLAVTMNRMLDRLERGQTRQRQFVSDTSHELRSPIAAIRQHAEVAMAHPARTTIAELAETVLAEDLRLQRLVDDLLLLTRVDEGTLELTRREVDLDDLVFEEAARLRGASGLEVDTAAVSAGRVNGDAMGLGRVLANLAENAARHARTRVGFSLSESDAVVRLRVDDDGPGIPQHERQRVFERFVRLDAARARDAGGSGLGLAIVAELVAAHGGRTTISESPEGGARVEVILPRAG
jgi:signal transduction histidine kinase